MNSRQIDQLADQFLKKTGIDLRKYRHHELASSLLDLSSLPSLRSNYFSIPLIASALIAWLVYSQAESPLQTNTAIFGGLFFIILNTLLLFSIAFIIQMKAALSSLLHVALDLSNQAARDLQTLQQGQQDGSLKSPSFAELSSATMQVVALPLILQTINSSFPILGRLTSPLTSWLGTLLIKRSLKKAPGQTDTLSREPISSEKLIHFQETTIQIKKLSGTIITFCSRIAILPSLLGILVLWLISILVYLLIF